MKAIKKIRIDVNALLMEAERSGQKESYEVLDRVRDYRIGVGGRLEPKSKPILFLEVLIKICTANSNVDLDPIEGAMTILKNLCKRGYSLNCEEGCCISCEIVIPPKSLAIEYIVARSIIERGHA